ncbi:MAG: riboflavin synthase [Ignavibacteria bacterium]|nr:riboflavin synthase [Ignavibacteria bacterium]
MFTGIIEEIGVIKSVQNFGGGKRFTITAGKVMQNTKIDDSISINGVCQTVVSLTQSTFTVEAVEETLRKTNFGKYSQGLKVNLERATQLGERLGGHLVTGHVDCPGRIVTIKRESAGRLLWIAFSPEYSKYAVASGSICIDGISLTIARTEEVKLMVSVIPHTWDNTTLGEAFEGKEVNLEFDIIAKYLEKLSQPYSSKKSVWEDIVN